MNGKGDTQRPRRISNEEWDERWKAIFRKPADERLAEMRHLLNSVMADDDETGPNLDG